MFNDSEMKHVRKIIRNIDGFLTDKEIALLYLLAKNGPGKGCIVEIGSWKGKSTVCLALGLKASKRKEKVYAIDWHRGSKEHGVVNTLPAFRKNIKKHSVSGCVMPMVMKSEDAAKMWEKKKKPIRLLWIDGSHEYKDVRKDFILWNHYLAEGGIVAFHDSFWDGPYKIVNEYIIKSGKFSQVGSVDYITFAVKSKPGFNEKLNNMKTLLIRYALKYPMKTEHLHPKFLNKFIKSTLLNDLKFFKNF